MAENYPMSLKQLLPVLEVIGNANKHIARVGKFLQKYGDLSLFPVKLQVRCLSSNRMARSSKAKCFVELF